MSKFYNNAKTFMLLASLTALILLIGSFWGRQGIIIALVIAAVQNLVGYLGSDRVGIGASAGSGA